MQALRKRHIRPGNQIDKLIPKSIKRDSVIRPEGKAQLHHTINLIKKIVPETKGDTRLLANYLKGANLRETCKNIWEFVYNHIQYSRDKTGIEQVRRPSRTWADRQKGVDCDCYSVFISTILTNLGIPHKLRITKYGGKPHFQHIYPIVPTGTGSYISLDCVTDQFDYEVPFSGVKDFDMKDLRPVGEISGVEGISGVDMIDISSPEVGRIGRDRMPLRKIQRSTPNTAPIKTSVPVKSLAPIPQEELKSGISRSKPTSQQVRIAPAQRQEDSVITKTRKIKVGIAGKVLLAVGVGLGTYKIIELLS